MNKNIIKFNTRGRIVSGENSGWFIYVVDDVKNSGGYFIFIAQDPDDPENELGYDDWAADFEELERYFIYNYKVIEWFDNHDSSGFMK